MKLTRRQATEIQEGVLDIRTLLKNLDNLDAFIDEISVLSNKFEANLNFAKE